MDHTAKYFFLICNSLMYLQSILQISESHVIRTILLVDDEQSLLDGLVTALRKEPFEFLTANSGQKALEFLEKHKVSVMVADEQMPGMRGNTLLEKANSLYPRTLRIMLTGHGNVQSALEAIHKGVAFRYIIKPCKPTDLMAAIRQGLLIQALSDYKWRMPTHEQDALIRRLRGDPSNSELENLLLSLVKQFRDLPVFTNEKDAVGRIQHVESLVKEYAPKGRFLEATACIDEYIDFWITNLAPESQCTAKVAETLANLALAYSMAGDTAKASSTYQASLDIVDQLAISGSVENIPASE